MCFVHSLRQPTCCVWPCGPHKGFQTLSDQLFSWEAGPRLVEVLRDVSCNSQKPGGRRESSVMPGGYQGSSLVPSALNMRTTTKNRPIVMAADMDGEWKKGWMMGRDRTISWSNCPGSSGLFPWAEIVSWLVFYCLPSAWWVCLVYIKAQYPGKQLPSK